MELGKDAGSIYHYHILSSITFPASRDWVSVLGPGRHQCHQWLSLKLPGCFGSAVGTNPTRRSYHFDNPREWHPAGLQHHTPAANSSKSVLHAAQLQHGCCQQHTESIPSAPTGPEGHLGQRIPCTNYQHPEVPGHIAGDYTSDYKWWRGSSG